MRVRSLLVRVAFEGDRFVGPSSGALRHLLPEGEGKNLRGIYGSLRPLDPPPRLRDYGKPAMVIIVAAMRKLLHLAWGVLRSQKPFNPNMMVAQ